MTGFNIISFNEGKWIQGYLDSAISPEAHIWPIGKELQCPWTCSDAYSLENSDKYQKRKIHDTVTTGMMKQ